MADERPPISWRLVRWVLLALAVPGASQGALADAPRLGPFEYPKPSELKPFEGDERFDPFQALNGSHATRDGCDTLEGRLWIELDGKGDCIRYYHHGLSDDGNPLALVYFGGDVMLRTSKGVRFITQSYSEQSPATIQADMAAWSNQAGKPAIFIARPGIYGSSGDHNQRRHLREMALMDRAVEMIKERYGIASFVVTGHSAGGQVAASLLNWRRDVSAAVISSGMTSVKQVADFWEKRRKLPGNMLYDSKSFYDPVTEIDDIGREPIPDIYILTDPEDRSIPFFTQLYYVRKLRTSGFEPHHLYLQAPGPARHLLADHAKLAAALIAQGKSEVEIRRAVHELSLSQIE